MRVEEFQPDRMTIKAELSTPAAAGWISPDALSATVKLRTLFGTAAAGRKVKGSFKLTPSGAAFEKYPDYLFVDPYDTSKSYDEDLGEVATGTDGTAKFDFKLERFDKGLYSLRFIAEGFEPEGGRSVVTDAVAIVSPAPYLVAYKADGDLGYIDKDSYGLSSHSGRPEARQSSGQRADHRANRVPLRVGPYAAGKRHTRLSIGAQRNIEREKSARDLAAGLTINLATAQAGSYALVIRDGQ